MSAKENRKIIKKAKRAFRALREATPKVIVPVDALRIEHLYQRTKIDYSVVNNIAFGLDLSLVDLHVSLRDDGHYYVIDGQHRLLGIRLRNTLGIPGEPPITHLEVKLYVGLTLEEEAEKYDELNNNRTPLTVYDKFKMQCVRGNPTALKIKELLTKACVSLQPLRKDLDDLPIPGYAVAKCVDTVQGVYEKKRMGDVSFTIVINQCAQIAGAGNDIVRELVLSLYWLAVATRGASLTPFWTGEMCRKGSDDLVKAGTDFSSSATKSGRVPRYLAEGVCNLLNHDRRTNFLLFDALLITAPGLRTINPEELP
jgi:hypothetical protein